MTEAVSLGELLHEEALFGLTGRRKGGSTPRTLIPVWTLPLRHISSSLGMTRPFTNGVEWGWKKCTDPMVGELDRLHSMTRAHPPLNHGSSIGSNTFSPFDFDVIILSCSVINRN